MRATMHSLRRDVRLRHDLFARLHGDAFFGSDAEQILRGIEGCAAHFFDGDGAHEAAVGQFQLQDDGAGDKILFDAAGASAQGLGSDKGGDIGVLLQ